MYEIIIDNLNKDISPILGYKDIVCSRDSVLGNPFFLNDESEREFVIIAYSKFLWRNLICVDNNKIIDPTSIDVTLTIASNFKQPKAGEIKTEINRIVKIKSNIRLLCWCYPEKCHAEVIKEAIEFFRRKVY